MRKTKIVCTIGPATQSEQAITELAKAGMNVARLNFSHGSYEIHKENIDTLKKVRRELACPLAIMLDTKGPEIRTKTLKSQSVTLKKGDSFTLTTNDIVGDEGVVAITYKELPSQVKKDDRILIDDGKIELKVESCTESDIICRVVIGGALGEKKGLNIPNVKINMPYLNDKDKEDLLFGIKNDVDFIAASFTRCKEDMIELRKFVDFNGGHSIRIIAKIENAEGIKNFDEILKEVDGIMVARGDMGVEIEYEKLPGLQKRFIRKCYQSGKMVITATQMLESMVTNSSPTRAEITDVANAVFDGTSAVMLSGETAMGKYPTLAVQTMAKIAEQAEKDAFEMNVYKDIHYEIDYSDTTNALCDAACTTARDLKAKAIIAVTKYGQTARRMSKFRPFEPLVAATPVEKTYHQLALSWGVYPVLAIYQKSSEELFVHAIDCAKQIDIVDDGDCVVIAAGFPLDTPGSTNTLRVETVGRRKYR